VIRAVRKANLSDSLCRKSVTLLLSTGGTKNFGLLFLRDLALRIEFRNAWHADSLTLVEFSITGCPEPLRSVLKSGSTSPRQSNDSLEPFNQGNKVVDLAS